MSRTNSQQRLGVEGIVLKQPSNATGDQWQVQIRKTEGAAGCADALNATFPSGDVAERYARRMMKIFRTENLLRVA